MAGVVLETLNIRKLLAFALMLLMLHASFFLIGGLISPSPHTTEQIIMTRCVDDSGDPKRWLYIRHFDPNGTGTNCAKILPDGDLDEVAPDLKDNELVFIAQFPHPRDGMRLSMTRWFQQILAILMLDIKQKFGNKLLPDRAEIVFDLRLGYHSRDEPADVWHELARSLETRPLNCILDPKTRSQLDQQLVIEDDAYYECEVLPLFTLASCHYDEYLLNLRIPRELQKSLGNTGSILQDVWMVEIHQNGGFTKIWFALKTTVFPISLLALFFFVSRVRELDRSLKVLERTIIVLGAGLAFLNCPVEWISLVWNSPFWIVLSDIRQGFFFAVLVCFWLVFTGEHMMDSTSRSRERVYWPRLLLVAGSCTALCIFELAERGVQIRNPFYSIWSNPVSARFGIASIVVGGVCALAYMTYLVYIIGCAFMQILNKRRLLSNLPAEQSRYYRAVIYRFTALLSYTLVCAVLTIVFFIFSRATEDQWSWGERKIEYTSAFITGVYGMWNTYVCAVLCLYAPSHKFRSTAGRQLYNRLVNTNSAASDPSNVSLNSGDAINLVPIRRDSSRASKREDPICEAKAGAFQFFRKSTLE